jgi:hypothetical protein
MDLVFPRTRWGRAYGDRARYRTGNVHGHGTRAEHQINAPTSVDYFSATIRSNCTQLSGMVHKINAT